VIKWFAANNLVINIDKMNIMKFITQNPSHSILHVAYKEEYKQQETMNTKFLGLKIYNRIYSRGRRIFRAKKSSSRLPSEGK